MMSHEIMIQNGKASMFYVGEVPWHGLGQKLDKPATAEEALQAAGLDWEVNLMNLYAMSSRLTVQVPGRYATIHGKTNKVLGVVGKDYRPLQNRDAFSFFDPIVGKGAAIYHTAGALGNGERVWMLAKLPGYIRVVGDDVSQKYLLLANGHDGKLAVSVKFTPVRVVCQNTLTLAMDEGRTLRFLHEGDMQKKMAQAHELLGLVQNQFQGLEESFQGMARVQMNAPRLNDYLKRVFPDLEDEASLKRAQQDRDWSEYFFREGQGNRMQGVSGTLWAAYNGVTEWIDHRKTHRQEPDQKLNSTWFGEAARVKTRAYTLAVESAKSWQN